VPATAILHLHDRDWVYVPVSDKQFRRVEVTGGAMLSGNMQEVLTGLKAGQRVVTKRAGVSEHRGASMRQIRQ